jgi:pimeloyl-ACP methyl ester carboxylesterase
MDNLVLIHGALGNAKEFDEISSFLTKNYNVSTYEIPHHGIKSNSTVPFTIDGLTHDLEEYISEVGNCFVYGFSLGGYIALSLAQKGSQYIQGVITHGTKLDWSPVAAEREVKSLDLDLLKTKVQPFYEYLHNLHGSYLSELLDKTASFMITLGSSPSLSEESVKSITCPVRMIRGGKDKMVSKEESLQICNSISNSYYFEIPSFIHPLDFINPKHVARAIEIQLTSFDYKWANTAFGDIAYKTLGEFSTNKPVLLFLHEAIGSIAQWKDFPEKLSNALDLPAIVLEFPGYGFSSEYNKPRDSKYLHHFALEHLPAFVKEIDLNQEIIIIGHSDGGTNALLYSAKYPKKIKGIVTMAAHVLNEKETKEGIYPAIEAYKSGKMEGLEMYHGEKTESLFYAWAKTWLSEDFSNWNIAEDIKNNSTPSLIIQGKDDQYGTHEQVNIICSLLKNAESFIIKDCGHAPHLENPKEVIEKIKLWSTNLK